MLDPGEQSDAEVEHVAQVLVALPGASEKASANANWAGLGWAGRGGAERRWGGVATCHSMRSASRDVLHAMMHAPSSIGRTEFTLIVVG